jgi:Patatin-like phospholipase
MNRVSRNFMAIHKMRTHLIGLFATLLLGACAGPAMLRDPVPAALVASSAIPGYSHIRYWGDDAAAIDTRMIDEVAAQQRESGNMATDRYFLSVSGGGSNGAFGAGILFGWTAAGTRPEFTVVTGISTGSLIAPFAFLGPPYDESLKAAYTAISGKDVYKKKGLLGIVGSESAADNTLCVTWWNDMSPTRCWPISFASTHAAGDC